MKGMYQINLEFYVIKLFQFILKLTLVLTFLLYIPQYLT